MPSSSTPFQHPVHTVNNDKKLLSMDMDSTISPRLSKIVPVPRFPFRKRKHVSVQTLSSSVESYGEEQQRMFKFLC